MADLERPAREEGLEEVVTEDSDSSDGMPELAGEAGADDEEAGEEKSQSRSERKAREAMVKLGMKKMEGINRVHLKKGKQAVFVIDRPDVFRAPGTDTYVIFGEARPEEPNSQAMAQQAQQFGMPPGFDMGGMGPGPEGGGRGGGASAQVEEEEEAEGGAVDEAGVEPRDIELVMAQSNVSRARAVKALRASDGDVVGAIMELTM